MESLASRVISIYNSGNFEFNCEFYCLLEKLIQSMNLYQYEHDLQANFSLVRHIHALTDANANSLADSYDEEQSHRNLVLIRSHLTKVKTDVITRILERCLAMKYESYEDKIARLLGTHQKYQEMVTRITHSMQSGEPRINGLIQVSLFFFLKNSQPLEKHILLYSEAIEYALNLLQTATSSLEYIALESENMNLTHIKKVEEYVGGLIFILRLALRLCQIMKFINGQSNLSLKFTILKRNLERVAQKHPQWKIVLRDSPNELIPIFKNYLCGMTQLNFITVCKWCLRTCRDGTGEHHVCRLLMSKKL